MKLHIGCGKTIIDNWVNLDIQQLSGVNIIDDVRTLRKIKDDSCDIIYACHVLEHISRNNIEKVLQTWYNKIKPGGIVRISVPDFEKIIMHYNKSKKIEEVLGLLVGGHKNEWDRHGMIFDRTILVKFLKDVGFKNIRLWNWEETEHSDYDDYSQAYLPHMQKNTGLLMSLNLQAEK